MRLPCFLTYLAVERQVSTSTQRQALNALSFFFKHVLERKLSLQDGFRPAKRTRRLPVVLNLDSSVDRSILKLSD